MSADNYALVGIHPLAGTGSIPDGLHGVYIGFMSNDYRPSEIPVSAKPFATHEEAAAYADELETEYGVRFLCNCTDEDEEPQLAERENKVLLYPATKKTVQQVVTEYTEILNVVYEARTAGDFTWKGVLYDFLGAIACTEDT